MSTISVSALIARCDAEIAAARSAEAERERYRCCICLCTLNDGDETPVNYMPIQLRPCNHTVCTECFPQQCNFFNCPMCRQKVARFKLDRSAPGLTPEAIEEGMALANVIKFARKMASAENKRAAERVQAVKKYNRNHREGER